MQKKRLEKIQILRRYNFVAKHSSDFYWYTKKDTCGILIEEREESEHDICPKRDYIKKR